MFRRTFAFNINKIRARQLTNKNTTLKQSFLCDSSPFSLESPNAVALNKWIYNSPQQYVIFVQDVITPTSTFREL